jgi:type IV pilus assembly protein PilP
MTRRAPALAFLALNALVALAACEDEIDTTPPPPPSRRAAVASASAVASTSAAPPAPLLSEADFTRSDSNRDPFFSYSEVIKPLRTADPGQTRPQALADRFALDELKLVGIVTGNTAPRAMFLDPERRGWIVGLGQFLGRAETVKTGGALGAEYELNWKVDRIRENDVVFIRETPGRPNVPSATRVVSLRSDDDRPRR